jgi:hypothetical protein
MKKLILILVLIFGFNLQSHSQTKKEKKEIQSEKEYQEIKELVNTKMYVFDATWISTKRGYRINISGGSNNLAVVQDSTKAAMQFFGEVTSIRFSGDEGVSFNNKMENYQVKFNDKKRRIIVSYNVRNKSETYDVYMSINKTGYTFVDVNSNNKSSVTYDGNVSAIKLE